MAAYREPKATDEHTYLFCGRQSATGELAALIENNLCVTLYGRTGIGKTSLLEAGVFPALRRKNYLPVMVRFASADVSLAEYVVQRIEEQVKDIRRTKERKDGPPAVNPSPERKCHAPNIDYLWEYFATRHFFVDGEEVFPVIVLDQFEENFIARKEETLTLLSQLYSLIDDNKIFPEGYHNETIFRIVISIREDDLYRLEDCIDRLRLNDFKFNRYRLVQLTDTEAREIIVRPGQAAGCLPPDEAECEAVANEIIQVVKDGNGGDINTLVLSLICSVLFNKMAKGDRPYITLNDVRSLGNNPLTDFYLSIPLKPKARTFLEDRLVDANGRRSTVNEEEMSEHLPQWKALSEGANRILQFSNGKIELVHDMLAQAIYDVRLRRKKKQKSKLLKTSVLIFVALCLACSLFSSVFCLNSKDDALSRKPLFPERKVVIDSADYEGDNYVEELIWRGKDGISINNCASLRHVVIDGANGSSVTLFGCPQLHSIEFLSDSVYISIANCPNLKTLNIPRYVRGMMRVRGNTDIQKIVPKDVERYVWLDNALWDIQEKEIVYKREKETDSIHYFPYECRDLSYVRYRGDTVFSRGHWIDNILFSQDSTFIIGYHSPIDPTLDLNRYEKLEGVEMDAFNGNKDLRKVVLKDSVKYGTFSFANCSNLDTLVISKGFTHDLSDVYSMTFNCGKIFYVLDSTRTRYKNAEGIVMENGAPMLLSSEYAHDYYLQGALENAGDTLLVLSHGFYNRLTKRGKKVEGALYGMLTDKDVAEQVSTHCNVFRVNTYKGSPFVQIGDLSTLLTAGKNIFLPSSCLLLKCSSLFSNTEAIHITNPKFTTIYNLPDSLARNITLYVPYGHLDEFLQRNAFASFKTIKELSLGETLLGSAQQCMANISWAFSTYKILIYLSALGLLIVGGFFFILNMTYKGWSYRWWRSLLASLEMMLFAFVSWVAFYWSVWFTFGVQNAWICSVIATLLTVAVLFAIYRNVLYVVSKVKWRRIYRNVLTAVTSLTPGRVFSFIKANVKRLIACLAVAACLLMGLLLWNSHLEKEKYAAHVADVAGKLCQQDEKETALLVLSDYISGHDYRGLAAGEEIDSLFRQLSHDLGYDQIILKGHSGTVSDVALSADGNFLASSSYDRTIKLWSLQDYTCVDSISGTNSYTCVALSPDLSTVAYGDTRGHLRTWYPKDSSRKPLDVCENRADIQSVAFNNTGNLLAAASSDGNIYALKLDSQYVVKEVWEGHTVDVNDLCFSSDGKYLYSCSDDSMVIRREANSGRRMELIRMKFGARLKSMSLSADDKTLAVSGWRDVYIHNLETQKTLGIPGVGESVRTVCLSPDGKFVAVGYNNYSNSRENIKIWELTQESAKPLHTLETGDGHIFALCFSKDGKWIYAASLDWTIRMWPIFGDVEDLLKCCERRFAGRSLSEEDKSEWGLE